MAVNLWQHQLFTGPAVSGIRGGQSVSHMVTETCWVDETPQEECMHARSSLTIEQVNVNMRIHKNGPQGHFWGMSALP